MMWGILSNLQSENEYALQLIIALMFSVCIDISNNSVRIFILVFFDTRYFRSGTWKLMNFKMNKSEIVANNKYRKGRMLKTTASFKSSIRPIVRSNRRNIKPKATMKFDTMDNMFKKRFILYPIPLKS